MWWVVMINMNARFCIRCCCFTLQSIHTFNIQQPNKHRRENQQQYDSFDKPQMRPASLFQFWRRDKERMKKNERTKETQQWKHYWSMMIIINKYVSYIHLWIWWNDSENEHFLKMCEKWELLSGGEKNKPIYESPIILYQNIDAFVIFVRLEDEFIYHSENMVFERIFNFLGCQNFCHW